MNRKFRIDGLQKLTGRRKTVLTEQITRLSRTALTDPSPLHSRTPLKRIQILKLKFTLNEIVEIIIFSGRAHLKYQCCIWVSDDNIEMVIEHGMIHEWADMTH